MPCENMVLPLWAPPPFSQVRGDGMEQRREKSDGTHRGKTVFSQGI